MPDTQDFPHYWTYNDTRLEELDRETLIEACATACEEVHRLRQENQELVKLAIYAPPGVAGNA